jgi:hypothetical protein
MSQLVLPFPTFNDGTIAYGSQVTDNNSAIVTLVNGSLDDFNLATQGITLHAKGKPGTVNATLMGAASVKQSAMDYSSTGSGVKAAQTVGYAGANGALIIRIEKTITIASVATEQTFAVDWSASDCPDGAVTFLVKPSLTAPVLLENGGFVNTNLDYIKWTVRSTTGATVAIKFSLAPVGGSVTLMALAMGAKL